MKIKRYEMVPKTRCGIVIDELEQCDEGEWMLYDQHEKIIAEYQAKAKIAEKALSLATVDPEHYLSEAETLIAKGE